MIYFYLTTVLLSTVTGQYCTVENSESSILNGCGSGTGPTDHWPVVKNAESCKLQHCSREMASCLLDSDCIESMTCSSSCAGDSFVAGLCAYECGERGLKSETYVDMMLCFGTHRCQEDRPSPGGPCAAKTYDEGVQEIDSLDKLQGEWWVLTAWACDASGISFATCQHWNINQTHTNVQAALQGPQGRVYKTIIQEASLPYPGVLRGTYGRDNAAFSNLPQLEDYHIIDQDDSHLLILSCHGLPEVNFNSALVLSRSNNINDLKQKTLDRFNQVIKEHGYDPEDRCIIDQEGCKREHFSILN